MDITLDAVSLEYLPDPFDPTELNFNKINFEILAERLGNVDWSETICSTSVNAAVQLYSSKITDILEDTVPKCVRKPSLPWFTPKLLRLKSRRNAALRELRKNKCFVSRRRFHAISNRYRKENNRQYQRYIRRSEESLRRNPKHFWNFVNNKRKDNGLPVSMHYNTLEARNTKEKCNLLAKRFASVFTSDSLSESDVNSAIIDVPADIACLYNLQISDEDIVRASKRLKPSSSPGPDGIPTCILKRCIQQLLLPLRHIFNLSISSGTFPDQWKSSFMFPVYKKGDRQDIANYRGITSLCSASKLFEVVVNELLLHNFKNYISTKQHGFFPGRSVTTNLVEFTSFVLRSMDEGAQVDAVYTDLKAAFDCLNHDILIAKLRKLGIGGVLLEWFSSYLRNRALKVKIGSCYSSSFASTSGVPQGSNLGPTLFSLFFNDVTKKIPPCCRSLYADDLKLFNVIRSSDDAKKLQQYLSHFENWCHRNRMSLSIDKCQVITFSRKRRSVIAAYKLNDISLKHVSSVTDLGVILDTKLNFVEHMTSTICKANRQLGFITKVCKSFRDPYCFRSLYCSLVRSILEFSCVVWSPSYVTWNLRVESVQRRFIRRALAHLPWNDPIALPPYANRCLLLNLETLSTRRTKAEALFAAKVILGDIDSPSLLGNLNFSAPSRTLRSSCFFDLSFRKTNYGKYEPIRRICASFNKYSSYFDFTCSSSLFKNRVDKVRVS